MIASPVIPLLPAPCIAGLLTATAPTSTRTPQHTMPDFSLLLQLDRPIIKPRESVEQTAEAHRDFLEMAYRRYLQTPDEHFRVSQWYYGPDRRGVKEVHPHKRVAEKLADVGLLNRHPYNNSSRSKYRISESGITYVEEALDRWIDQAPHDTDVWLPRFESYARQLKLDDWYILPEPGRSWRFEQAFENERGTRKLHRIKYVGFPDGHGWDEHDSYFYTQPGYDYRETAAFRQFQQPVRMDIPF